MSAVVSNEKPYSSESETPSREPTIAGSHFDDEKAINNEDFVNPSIAEAPAAAPPSSTPPRATGFRFALIFVGYVCANNVNVWVVKMIH
jgi:hypothetical protein